MNTEARYDFGDFKLKYVIKFEIIDADVLKLMFNDVETLIEKILYRHDINLKQSIDSASEELSDEMITIKKLSTSNVDDFVNNISFFKDILDKHLL